MQSPDYKPNKQEIIKACDRQIADLEGKMRHRNSPYKLLQIKREIKELQEIKRNCMMSLAVFGETTEPAETTCDICGKKIVGIENFEQLREYAANYGYRRTIGGHIRQES